MIINRIEPQGYCSGVKQALQKAYEIINDESYPRPIYLLGSIIHNQHVMTDLVSKGCILVEEKNTSRLELLKKIPSGTVIFSAHGVAPSVLELAQKKNLRIVDTTCKNVLLVQARIKEALKQGYTVMYIGTKGHPECEGILGISSKIILIETQQDIDQLSVSSKKIYVTNQTTLSFYDTQMLYEALKKKFPLLHLDNKICYATTIRQKAVKNQKPTDLCIIVGDKNSSNTKKLFQTSIASNIPSILVEDIEELKHKKWDNISSVSITSGASTPEHIVNEIIDYLKRVD